MRVLSRGFTVLAAVAAAAFGLAGGAVTAAGAASSHTYITVMTRNLDEGTDFGYVMAAADGRAPLLLALLATYNEVLKSDVCGRAERIADEISGAQPDLVSVQEAARWTGPAPANCPASGSPTTIDAEAALMARLEADGAHYTVIGAQDEFSSSSVPLPLGLSFLDRDLLLARVEPASQMTLSAASMGHYATQVELSLGPLVIPIPRGWISVDATRGGTTVRFIATHLESFNEPVQEAQAMELASGPGDTSLPVILAGDLNTGPGSSQVLSYEWLTSPEGGMFADTWSATHPRLAGFTDGFYTEDPKRPRIPWERIDLVLVRGMTAHAQEEYLTGLEIPHPSDHAGVVAKVGFMS